MIREANKTLLVIVLVISVVVFLAFSFVVWFKFWPIGEPNEKFWDWLIALVGTLLSFIIGLAGGALHLQTRRKNHLRALLRQELKETLDLSYIHPLVVEEAVKSGLFDDDLNRDMLGLAKMYHKYNHHVTTLRTARGAKSQECIQSSIESLKKPINDCRQHIFDNLNHNRNGSAGASPCVPENTPSTRSGE